MRCWPSVFYSQSWLLGSLYSVVVLQRRSTRDSSDDHLVLIVSQWQITAEGAYEHMRSDMLRDSCRLLLGSFAQAEM